MWITLWRTIASVDERDRSSPSNTTRPPRTGLSPEIARSNAVLPAPFAPSTPTIAPVGTSSDTSFSTLMPV